MRRPLFHAAALSAVLVAALNVPSARAVTVSVYETQRDNPDQSEFRTMKIYLTGVVAGFIWGNSELAGAKKPVLFCQPPPPKVNEDTVRLIDDEIGQPYVTRDLPVELLLLNALVRKYPCS